MSASINPTRTGIANLPLHYGKVPPWLFDRMVKLAREITIAIVIDFGEWRFTTARKEHTDEFGDKITEGQVYFKREYGGAWDEVLKLSRGSMEKVLFCIFNGNFLLEKMCEHLVQEKWKRLYETHQKYSPLNILLNMDKT